MAIFDDFRPKQIGFAFDPIHWIKERIGRYLAAISKNRRERRVRTTLGELPDHLLQDAGLDHKSAAKGKFIPLGGLQDAVTGQSAAARRTP